MNYFLKNLPFCSLCFILVVFFLSTTAHSNLDDSKHNFTDHNVGTLSPCMFCHTPHSADVSIPGVPLWAISLPHDSDFILYGDGSTTSGTLIDDVGTNTKMCMSCHDETLGTSVVIGGVDKIDLNMLHPIGFEVDQSVAGLDSIDGMVAAGAKFFGLDANRMECGSCHDPHETAPEKQPFLRMVNTSICTDCHVNK